VEFYGNVNAQPFRTVTERHSALDVRFYRFPRTNSQYELKTVVARCLPTSDYYQNR